MHASVIYTLTLSLLIQSVSAVTYTRKTSSKTWIEALDDCWTSGGTLGIVDSQADNADVIDTESSDDVWLGLSDGHTEGVWRWTNGKVASWTNWEPGQPSGGNSKNCVYKKSGGEGYWTTDDCSASKKYICQDVTEHEACADNIVTSGQGADKECLGYRAAQLESSSLCHQTSSAVSYYTNTQAQCQGWCYLRPDVITISCSYSSTTRCKMSQVDGSLSSTCLSTSSSTRQYIDSTLNMCSSATITEGQGAYSTAEASCTLPKIINAEDESAFMQLMVDKNAWQLWIGLTYDSNTGSWKWQDGSYPEGYQNWKSGEPNVNGNNCAYIDRNEVKWKQGSCTAHYKYVCGVTMDNTCLLADVSGATRTYDSAQSLVVYTCTDGLTFTDGMAAKSVSCNCGTDTTTLKATIQGWGSCGTLGSNANCDTDVFAHTGVCYWIQSDSLSWQDAWMSCYGQGGRLAMLHDQTTSDFVLSNLPNDAWIGLTDGISEGTFRWSNTQAADPSYDRFASWPTATDNECVHHQTDGDWDIEDCDTTKASICQSYHASLPLYQCDDLQDGCLGLWPDKWTVSSDCVIMSSGDLPGIVAKYTTGVTTLDECKKLCKQQINFKCRTIQFESPGCAVLEVKKDAIPNSVKSTNCGSMQMLHRTPLARDTGICYSLHEDDVDPAVAGSTAAASKTYCESKGRDIYKVTSDEEQTRINTLNKDCWSAVKMYSIDGQGSFQYRYMDGTYPEYMPWQSDEPTYLNSKKCVRSQGGDKLAKTDACTATKNDVICEASVAIHCASLVPTDNNADISTTFSADTNSYVTVYACHQGYYFMSTQQSQQSFSCDCTDDSSSISFSESCQIVDCGSLPSIVNTQLVSGGGSTIVNSTAQYQCATGFLPQTVQTVRCQDNATWTDLPQTCEVINCGTPSSLQNGDFTTVGGTTTYGMQTNYTCNSGYVFNSGNSVEQVTCLASGSWSALAQVCTVVDCGTHPTISDGGPTVLGATTYNTTVTYQCDLGYKFSSDMASEDVVCQSTAMWTTISSTCQEIDCGNPSSSITNGYLYTNNNTITIDTTYSGIVQYMCNNGYTFGNNITLLPSTCEADGLWSNLSSPCVRVDCGSLPVVHNASVVYTEGTLYTDINRYQCNEGTFFSPGVTLKTITCLGTGNWDELNYTCVDIDCGTPPSLNRGYINTYNNTVTVYPSYNSTARYLCDYGYGFINNESSIISVCQINGSWSALPSTCNRVDCGPIPAVHNGSVDSSEGTLYNDTTVLKCNIGAVFSQGIRTRTITCKASGNWDRTNHTCVDIDCGTPPVLFNGYVYTNNNTITINATFDSTATYHCDNGYTFENNASSLHTQCWANGVWNPLASTCVKVDCGSVPPVQNGSVESSNGTLYSDRTTLRCDQGMEFSAGVIHRTITCQGNGEWDSTNNICVESSVNDGTTATSTDSTSNNAATTDPTPTTPDSTDSTSNNAATTDPTPTTPESIDFTSNNAATTDPTPSTPESTVTTSNNAATTEPVTTIPDSTGSTANNVVTPAPDITTTSETTENVPESVTLVDIETTSEDVDISTVTTTMGTTLKPGLRCTRPTGLSNTLLTESYPFVGAHAVYQCKKGFEFSDHSSTRTMQCQPGAMWHTEVDNCEVKQCQDIISTIENAVCDETETHSSVLITCVCEGGYRFSNGQSTAQFECSNRRKWNIHPGNCKSRCPEVPIIRNSKAVWEGVNESGSAVLIQCDIGHRFTDGDSEKWMGCTEDLEWEDLGHCLIDTCPAIPESPHRIVNSTLAVYGTVVEIECDEGYTFYPGVWVLVTECQELGIWNMTEVPQCVDISCQVVQPISNALSIGNGTGYGTNVLYPCISITGPDGTYRHTDGYTSKTISCQQDSQWSAMELSCELGRCEPVPEILHAIPDNTLSTPSNLVTYTCDQGYMFSDNIFQQTVQCNNGWNISQQACQVLLCPEAPVIGHASPDITENVYNTTIEYTCQTGYLFYNRDITNSTNTIRCGETQNWQLMGVKGTQEVPTQCSLQRCGPLPTIAFAQTPVEYDDTYGTTITVGCRSGYWAKRGVFTQPLTCTLSGEWEPAALDCVEVTCPALASWTGVYVNITDRYVGAIVLATCNQTEEKLERVFTDRAIEKEAKCSSEGEWVPDIPDCMELVPKPVFQPAPTEAKNAQKVGIIGAMLVSVTFVLIFVADLPFFIDQLFRLQKLVQDIRHREENYVED